MTVIGSIKMSGLSIGVGMKHTICGIFKQKRTHMHDSHLAHVSNPLLLTYNTVIMVKLIINAEFNRQVFLHYEISKIILLSSINDLNKDKQSELFKFTNGRFLIHSMLFRNSRVADDLCELYFLLRLMGMRT